MEKRCCMRSFVGGTAPCFLALAIVGLEYSDLWDLQKGRTSSNSPFSKKGHFNFALTRANLFLDLLNYQQV